MAPLLYPRAVLTKFHMALSALLVTLHVAVVPWHVFSAHHDHLDDAAAMHVHGPHDEEHHHDEPPDGNLPAFEDASGFGAPHRHSAHEHSVTDHGYLRVRGDNLPLPAAMVMSVPVPRVSVASIPPVPAAESPPPKSTDFNVPHLRGPPAC